jgi:hypothetical protein
MSSRTVTASTTATTDDFLIKADCTSNVITVTLFTNVTDYAFYQIEVTKTDSSANAVTVTDGTFTFSLTNQYDAVICQLDSAGVWTGIASFDVGGSGNVTGPGSATADDIATFSGTTGKVIKDSGIAVANIATADSKAVSAGTTGASAASAAVVADSKAVSAAKGSPLAVVVISATSVFTPTASATCAFFECWGGGGGGGGTSQGGAGSAAAGGGGGAGGYSAKFVAAITGSVYSITIGASGAGGPAASSGGTGGSTLVSTVISAAGGVGGAVMNASTFFLPVAGGAGGAVTTGGDINIAGNPGQPGLRGSGTSAMAGNGGVGNKLGGGGLGAVADGAGGAAGPGSGAGGGGGMCSGGTSRAGGDGSVGCVVVTLYR